MINKEMSNVVELLIKQEQEKHKPSAQAMESYTNNLRMQFATAITTFRTSFMQGYEALIDELSSMVAKNTSGKDPLQQFRIDDAHMREIGDMTSVTQKLAQGLSLYEVLGFTPDTMKQFYQAATRLIEKGKMTEAKNGFYFLVTIAPRFSPFWLGLGFCYSRCGEYQRAVQSAAYACELDPRNPECFAIFARVCQDMDDRAHALEVCQKALQNAQAHSKEPWSASFIKEINQTISQLKK